MQQGCEPTVKRALMSLLKRGSISTLEAAKLGCVTEQAVRRWVDKAGWDMKRKREAFATREFARVMGTSIGRQKSKREMKVEAEEASAAWEWRRDEDRSIDVEEMGTR